MTASRLDFLRAVRRHQPVLFYLLLFLIGALIGVILTAAL